MDLNVWFPDQIANIILALAETSAMMASVTTDHPEAAEAFHAGYRAALLAVACAFGISPPPPLARCRAQDVQYPVARGFLQTMREKEGNHAREN